MCAYSTLMFNHFHFSSQNYRYDMNIYEPIPTTTGMLYALGVVGLIKPVEPQS